MPSADHWHTVFTTKTEREVSWFEPVPDVSLSLMAAAGLNADRRVLDVGGGDSHLVDALLARGLRGVTVLDISDAALTRSRARLGQEGDIPTWIVADVTGDWSAAPVDIWHDRALFHFLTAPEDRARYLVHLHETVKPGGSVIIATFAMDGPERCSGLPVVRYSSASLAEALGTAFEAVEARPHVHQTPWGAAQSFQYSRFVRRR